MSPLLCYPIHSHFPISWLSQGLVGRAKLVINFTLCLILESCVFGKHPWALWLRSALALLWSYQEFLSVTPLGVRTWRTCLQDMQIIHCRTVSQTWAWCLERASVKGEQRFTAGIVQFLLWLFRAEHCVWTTAFSKEKLQYLHISNHTDPAVVTSIAVPNLQPDFPLLSSAGAFAVLCRTGPSVYIQAMEKYYFCTKWDQCVPSVGDCIYSPNHCHFSSLGPNPESGNGGIKFNQGRLIVCVIFANLTCHRNVLNFFFKSKIKHMVI